MSTASIAPDRASHESVDAGAIVVSLDGTVVQTLPVTARVLTIGRLPENVVVLPHQSVSRQHAELRLERGGPVLTDMGSAAGSYVGAVRLTPHQPHVLPPGVVARIGPYSLEYRAPLPPRDLAEQGHPGNGKSGPGHDGEMRDAVAAIAFGVRDDALHATALAAPTVDERLADPSARPTVWEEPPPVGRSRYLNDLPVVFHDNDFLARMLQIFEAIWEPLERRVDHAPLYFAPRTAPASLLPWLASWVGLSLDAQWPERRRRDLLAEAMELYRWRGTPYGLTRMIEVSTGLTPTVSEDPATPFVFRVAVRVPDDSAVRRDVIEELVRQHKPAHVGYVLEVTP